mgnify:CR=1 FL=1
MAPSVPLELRKLGTPQELAIPPKPITIIYYATTAVQYDKMGGFSWVHIRSINIQRRHDSSGRPEHLLGYDR